MSDTFNTTPSNWQGVDAEPIAGSHNLVESGGVFNADFSNFLDAKNYTDNLIQTPTAEYKNITLTKQFIRGYAESNGIFHKIEDTSIYYGFYYVAALKGHTYRMTGSYSVGGTTYANMLFSESIPTTDSVGIVIDSNKGSNTPFDITYTARSNGYILIWCSSSIIYSYNFYDYEKNSYITSLQKDDAKIKTVIDYTEIDKYITESIFVKGSCRSNTNVFNYNDGVSYGYYAFELQRDVKYNISGQFIGRAAGYAGIIFLETLPSNENTEVMCIELEQYEANTNFNIDYIPNSDGYIMLWTTSTISVSYKVPQKNILTPNDLYKHSFVEPMKIVNQGYYHQKLMVYKPTGKVDETSTYGSFVIPVLEGERYIIRGKSTAYSNYAVISFSTSIVIGTVTNMLVTVDETHTLYSINYDFTAPSDGYLIIWSTSGDTYGSQNYIEVCKMYYRQDINYDYYLPDLLTIQTFGDSITDNTWGDMSSWVNYIPDNIHTELNIINSGVGGIGTARLITIVEEGGTTGSGSPVLPIQSNADIVVIFIGTNDWAGGATIDAAKSNLISVFQYITEHSSARVLFCTPLQRYNSVDQGRDTNSYGEPLNNNISLREFCTGLVEICNMYSIPVLDLNTNAGINRFNIFNYSEDGLHPHRDGDIYISNLICKKIKEMVRGSN